MNKHNDEINFTRGQHEIGASIQLLLVMERVIFVANGRDYTEIQLSLHRGLLQGSIQSSGKDRDEVGCLL